MKLYKYTSAKNALEFLRTHELDDLNTAVLSHVVNTTYQRQIVSFTGDE